ncbi:MAG: hypothetical protein IIU45_05510, partial [Lachnospiraceae bacterium]|nr:hypothetical protein [Lachnospiraceae bacterium]
MNHMIHDLFEYLNDHFKSSAVYPSGLYLLAPSLILNGQSYQLSFRDAMNADITNITCTAENAQVGSF